MEELSESGYLIFLGGSFKEPPMFVWDCKTHSQMVLRGEGGVLGLDVCLGRNMLQFC